MITLCTCAYVITGLGMLPLQTHCAGKSIMSTSQNPHSHSTTGIFWGGWGGGEKHCGPSSVLPPQMYMSSWKKARHNLAWPHFTGRSRLKLRLQNREPKEEVRQRDRQREHEERRSQRQRWRLLKRASATAWHGSWERIWALSLCKGAAWRVGWWEPRAHAKAVGWKP